MPSSPCWHRRHRDYHIENQSHPHHYQSEHCLLTTVIAFCTNQKNHYYEIYHKIYLCMTMLLPPFQ